MLGTTISHYKVIEKIGQGGMGEVFLAHDTSLDGKVALKFLPEELQQDSTARKRFLREAKSAAALDHPYICHIHEVGEVEGKSFISMEYVQGETLKEKLAKGPLPLNDALEQATEVAEALEEAHKHGIVHRDLKPSNIMLTPQGHVKVMDFGLAKRVTPVEGQEQEITTALTKQGSTLGTVPYMSPEQVRGQEVDTRSDIFSFGVVLYEMLTGVDPFKKSGAIETANAILSETAPPLTRYTEEIPVLLQHIVKKMLAKEPDRRYQLVHDVRTDLGELMAEGGSQPDVPAPAVSRRRNRGRLAWGLASLVVGIIITLLAVWYLNSPPPPEAVTRFVLRTPEAVFLANVVISPDGRRIVFETRGGLFVQEMDQFQSRLLGGTEGARNHFISPDGRWLGFWAGGKIKKVSLTGGDPVDICDVGALPGAAWGPDGTILFSPHCVTGLWRVSSDGGDPEPLTKIDPGEGEVGHWWPVFLPDGKAFLFTIFTSSGSLKKARMAVFNLQTREKTILGEGAYPRYVPTGHLVYQRAGSFEAVPFDLADFRVTGPSVTILEEARKLDPVGSSSLNLSFSSDGTLVYIPGSLPIPRSALVWMDRMGHTEPLPFEPQVFNGVDLSSDGRQLAVSQLDAGEFDLWLYDLQRGRQEKLTHESNNVRPVWSHDGGTLAFTSLRRGAFDIFSKEMERVDLVKPLLTDDEHDVFALDWSRDGRFLIYGKTTPETGEDIWVLPREDPSEPQALVSSPFAELFGQVSPDGNWFTYGSNESGRQEVYVQPFRDTGRRTQVSINGGNQPHWSPAGNELFFYSEGQLMVVRYESREGRFDAGEPQPLFEVPGFLNGSEYSYAVAPDGQRFLMLKNVDKDPQINVVLNWFEELKERVPVP